VALVVLTAFILDYVTTYFSLYFDLEIFKLNIFCTVSFSKNVDIYFLFIIYETVDKTKFYKVVSLSVKDYETKKHQI